MLLGDVMNRFTGGRLAGPPVARDHR